jgi:hypothetical protein
LEGSKPGGSASLVGPRLRLAGGVLMDTVERWCNGVLSMTGNVGEAAKWTVEDSGDGSEAVSGD